MGDVEGSRFASTKPPKKRAKARRPVGTPRSSFLPMCQADLDERGWDGVDIVIVTGDAYVDHPAFGPVLIARFLEARGYRVGMISQPDWRSAEPFKALGRPRLYFGVSAGNLDSMLNRLTSQKKNRGEDQYSPGGETGRRPDRASMVYAQRCREAFKGIPVVLGGIESSLRRIAHYDYWSDTVRRSILLDSKADLLVFGMGERPIWEVTRRLDAGESIRDIKDVRGTAWVARKAEVPELLENQSERVGDGKILVLPSYEDVVADKEAYAKMARLFQKETNPGNGRPLMQAHGDRSVYYNPPAFPLDDDQGTDDAESISMDSLYDLPFTRIPHPSYHDVIPAYETVKHSVVLMRGCFGGCTFCSITEHEGRIIQSRSAESVLKEIRELRRMDDFRGTITDLGGPTANMYKMKCKDPEIEKKCRRLSCVHPKICTNLNTDHAPTIDVMEKVHKAEGVKHVFIASGVRYDLAERDPAYVDALAKNHVGGHLSVAPEHASERVLDKMKKPGIESFERFKAMFDRASKGAGKEQYDIPYFISGHPGCELDDMVELALWLKKNKYRPRQVQDFIPTPMSVASAMYYTGIDPLTSKPVHVARGLREKKLQKALLFYWNKEWWPMTREALRKVGREDLIGKHPAALVPPEEHRPGRGSRGRGGRGRSRGRGARRQGT